MGLRAGQRRPVDLCCARPFPVNSTGRPITHDKSGFKTLNDRVAAFPPEFDAEYAARSGTAGPTQDIAIEPMGALWQQSSIEEHVGRRRRPEAGGPSAAARNGAGANGAERTTATPTSRARSSSSCSPRSRPRATATSGVRLPVARQGHRRRAPPRLQRARRPPRGVQQGDRPRRPRDRPRGPPDRARLAPGSGGALGRDDRRAQHADRRPRPPHHRGRARHRRRRRRATSPRRWS